jgi:hypothetical protein
MRYNSNMFEAIANLCLLVVFFGISILAVAGAGAGAIYIGGYVLPGMFLSLWREWKSGKMPLWQAVETIKIEREVQQEIMQNKPGNALALHPGAGEAYAMSRQGFSDDVRKTVLASHQITYDTLPK